MAYTETKVINKKYRVCTDPVRNYWDRVSFWTDARDLEFSNGINGNQMISQDMVTLTANSWTSTAPYTQVVNVPRITSNHSPIISMGVPSSATGANYKAMKKNYGCIDRVVSGNGTLTFYCYNKKPSGVINVLVKGV